MITSYILEQLAKAKYKILDDGMYFGEIPGLQGVWANGKTLEVCRTELADILESWLYLKTYRDPPSSKHLDKRLGKEVDHMVYFLFTLHPTWCVVSDCSDR